ncbi:F-box domain containing protein [Pandoravirus salinus]|uniref:F-box domain containing protein n=1 Tax=Pandoravirus salinus TaxID=1349410 RepID=S4W1V1_9VIRU|nr:F-box domain [Pandoravirus salinus]AGO84412.1 F-box domain containing protein [Pandoravirus salinus]
MSLDDLPDELVTEIIRSLRSVRAVGSLAATSWRYNRLTMDDLVWRGIYVERFGAPMSTKHFFDAKRTWRWLYRARLPACLTAPTSVGTALGASRCYSGDWVDGRMHGTGFSFAKSFGVSRLGRFPSLDRDPAGFARWRTEPRDFVYHDMYAGEWKEGYRDGFGIMTYGYGEQYEGDWKRGRRYGKGTYTRSGYVVECEWKDDLREGPMTVTYGDHVWTGDAAQGSFRGIVTLLYPNGRVWGQWKGKHFSGLVIHSGADGSCYSGMCEKGRAHGLGVLHQKDGRRYETCWREGVLDGDGIVSYADGSRWQGYWATGTRIDGSIVAHGNTPIDGATDCDCLACLDVDGFSDSGVEPEVWPPHSAMEAFGRD